MLKKTSLFLSKSLRQFLDSDPEFASSSQLEVALSIPALVIAGACKIQLDSMAYDGPPAFENILGFGHSCAESIRRVFTKTQRVETSLQMGVNKSISFKLEFCELGPGEAPFVLNGSVNKHGEICNVWCRFLGASQ